MHCFGFKLSLIFFSAHRFSSCFRGFHACYCLQTQFHIQSIYSLHDQMGIHTCMNEWEMGLLSSINIQAKEVSLVKKTQINK